MIGPYFVVEIRNKFTGVKKEAEDSNWCSSVNRSEVEARARELNDGLSPEEKERFEYFCSEPKTTFRGLQMESLREPLQ